MTCFSPLHGWRSRERTENGKRKVVFRHADGFRDRRLSVPCGSCAGCLLERAGQWAVRCAHEASLWPVNSFVTLTYDSEHVPRVRGSNGHAYFTLRPQDVVAFLKALRRARAPQRLRFFQCGEYGELGRPHHHLLLFNCGFPDATLWRTSSTGLPLFRSAELEKLWSFGHSSVGSVTRESAGYTARYTLKKVGSSVVHGVQPYVTMSRAMGIGKEWFRRFHGDVTAYDAIVHRGGKKSRPPRYYDELLDKMNPSLHRRLKSRRIRAAVSDYQDFLDGKPSQLAKAEVARRRVADFLKRSVE